MFQSLPISSLIQLITAFVALGVIALLWKNRNNAEVRFLMLVQVSAAIWAFFYAAEFSTPVLEQKILWSQLSYLGITFLPVSYFFFTLAYRQKNGVIQPIYFILASVIPVLTLFIALTNGQHHLIWKEVSLPPGSNMTQYEHGVWFWVYFSYAFLLIIAGIYNLIRAYFEFNKIYASHITILLLGSIIPVLGNLAYNTGLNPIPGFDWTTSCFVLTGLIIAVGVYSHRMFEILPLATRQLFKILREGIIVINKEGVIEDANPATYEIFNWQGKEIVQSSALSVFDEHKEVVNILKDNREEIIHLKIKRNGILTYYQVKVSLIRNSKQQVTGKLLMVNDVTSIRKSEYELRGKNKQLMREIEKNEKLIADLDSFAHTVAHDLKNMLGAIYSSSEAVIDSLKAGDTEFVAEASSLVKESAIKTIQITDDLMKLATSGYEEVQKEPVDMNKVFEQAKSQLSDIFKQYDATVTIVEDLIPVVAYGPWIEEVWINYMSNAIKYGGRPPVITVGSYKIKKGLVKFWIKDNGDGITPEHHELLFQKHTRFHTDKAFGYGLGLSIVKRIVEKMGGSVGVESNGEPGKGSEFYFILPIQ